MELSIKEDDVYGYPFRLDPVLVIMIKEEELQSLLADTTGRTAVVFETRLPADPACVPQEIFFLSEESWYVTRFHSFVCENGRLSFKVYMVKALYMASAGLLSYKKRIRLTDGSGRIYYFFSDKVDQSGQNAQDCPGHDIVGIVDTAEDADEAFAGAGQKQQDADRS